MEDRGYYIENVINSEAFFVHKSQKVREFMNQKVYAREHDK
jgi:hypothetical protein